MFAPPRPEAKRAIARCKKAGIRPVMVTGDHKNTAQAIAEELRMLNKEDRVLTGRELKELSDEELKSVVQKVGVYARVSPEDKLRIVNVLQEQGEVVAMTGEPIIS
ncbi:HAD family hydrolase [Fuchsiella alkaliacetigena]|nr:HAD family hydrolase [Fuchsiella alkaliacetigena]MCK8826085.1 HAD family hydrolase [Fuchsiella alkaliacetigena]